MACLHDCNDRGTCAVETNTCICGIGFTEVDCSVSAPQVLGGWWTAYLVAFISLFVILLLYSAYQLFVIWRSRRKFRWSLQEQIHWLVSLYAIIRVLWLSLDPWGLNGQFTSVGTAVKEAILECTAYYLLAVIYSCYIRFYFRICLNPIGVRYEKQVENATLALWIFDAFFLVALIVTTTLRGLNVHRVIMYRAFLACALTTLICFTVVFLVFSVFYLRSIPILESSTAQADVIRHRRKITQFGWGTACVFLCWILYVALGLATEFESTILGFFIGSTITVRLFELSILTAVLAAVHPSKSVSQVGTSRSTGSSDPEKRKSTPSGALNAEVVLEELSKPSVFVV